MKSFKCPFCYINQPTWEHVSECGKRRRKEIARREREKQAKRDREEQERRRQDMRDGTWHGWRCR